MNYPQRLLTTFRRLVLAPASALGLAASFVDAQEAPAVAVEAATLVKYDKNKNGKLDPDELAAKDADEKRIVPVTTVASVATPDQTDAYVLSPFEVVSDTKGYYASNTMSGTRFNTKLEDLGSAITVMTKEQMEDFAMLDINDIFLYAANTEGTGTYTAQTVNRNGDVQEDVSMNPTQANRVRGIAPANISVGNTETMGRTPVDPLAVDAIEISRGANANVFGLGNPSGTVNMVPSSANLRRDRTQIQVRADSYSGYRTSLDVNRVLVKGVLSARLSGSFQHDGFILKPSGVNSIRYNAMLKFQPFKKTSVTGSFSYYKSNGNRPNASPLRDNVSYWVEKGRPTWDPISQVIHVNGTTIGNGGVGTSTPITSDTNIPDYFNRSFTGSGRTYVYVGQSGIAFMNTAASTQSTNPGTGSGTLRLMSLSAGAGVAAGRFTGQPLFTTTPVVSDKAIYDYTKINLTAINRSRDANFHASINLDHTFFATQRQNLALQASFVREDSKKYTRNTLGELNSNGQSSQMLVDINERRMDGTPNPFFLHPYIGIDQPYTIEQPQRWDTTRAQLLYQLDLSREKNILHWLGVHRLNAYQEFKYRVRRSYSYQDRVRTVPGLNGVNVGTNVPAPYFRYYIGDAIGNNVDYAPTSIVNGKYPMLYGNPTTGFVNESTELALAASTGKAGGASNNKTILKTVGGVLQSSFLDNRVVTTFGKREDLQYNKRGATPVQLTADGLAFNYDGNIDHWAAGDYTFGSGKTTQKGAVVRPFRGWKWSTEMASSSGVRRLLGQFLTGLSLTYNESDSFRPEEPRYSLYEKELPNPYGVTKDEGVTLNMFDNKFVVTLKKYTTTQVAARGGDAGTYAQRVTRIDFSGTDPHQLANQAVAWIAAVHPGLTTEQIQAEAGRQMGMPWERQQRIEALFNSNRLASPNDIVSQGYELELNFNPTNYWTLSASATDTQSFNKNVSREIAQWIDERMPYWTTVRDERDGALWWNKSYGGSPTPAQNFAQFVGTPYAIVRQAEGTAQSQARRYAFRSATNLRLSGLTQNKILRNVSLTGSLRWQDKGSIGYYGLQQLPAVITDLDKSRQIFTPAQYFFDAGITYRFKMWADKIATSVQLNARNLTENGHRLQATGAYPDGTPHSYRIVDPRQFILTATFDL